LGQSHKLGIAFGVALASFALAGFAPLAVSRTTQLGKPLLKVLSKRAGGGLRRYRQWGHVESVDGPGLRAVRIEPRRGALDAETRSSIPDVSAAKSDDARLPMLYPQRRQSLCGIVRIGIRQDWWRDSNLRIWESDPLHSLSHKRGLMPSVGRPPRR